MTWKYKTNFRDLFDDFLNLFLTLTMHRGLWGPKMGQLNRKSVLFANDALCLVTNPQTNTKADLNEYNEHSIRRLTGF